MWFEQLIHPQTTTTFLKETRGVNWLRSIGSPDRFERLFPMSQFERWLSETRWDPERIYLIKNAQRYPSSMYLFSPELPRGWRPIGAVVQRLMQEGATLVANAVDESLGEVAKLAEEFEDVFDVSVGVNVYATRGDQQAFNAHWDEHDVFVVQVRGSKNWCVWKPTSLHPVPEVSALVPPPHEEVWSGELRAGDVLYLPRGWWHRAQGANTESVHLSVGILEPTGRDFLKWLTARTLASSVFRQSLPLPNDSEKVDDWLAKSREKLFKLWTRALLDEFRNERAMKGFARPRIDLKLNEGQRERHDAMTNVRLARTRWVVSKPTDDGEIAITVGNTTLRTTPAVGEILGRLKNTSTIPVSALMDDAMRRDCVDALQTALDTLRLSDQVEFLQE